MAKINVAVLGAPKVGKTCLIRRFCDQLRRRRRVGQDRYVLTCPIGGGQVVHLEITDLKISIWTKILRVGLDNQVRNANAFIVVYALDDPASFCVAMDLVLRVYKCKASMDVPLVLLGNKADLPRKVSSLRLSMIEDIPQLDTSAFSERNVTYVLDLLLKMVLADEGQTTGACKRMIRRMSQSLSGECISHQSPTLIERQMTLRLNTTKRRPRKSHEADDNILTSQADDIASKILRPHQKSDKVLKIKADHSFKDHEPVITSRQGATTVEHRSLQSHKGDEIVADEPPKDTNNNSSMIVRAFQHVRFWRQKRVNDDVL